MKKQPKNISASVHQRLLNKARSEKRSFNELVQYFAMERFLYRLSKSVHYEKYILKGALLLHIWRSSDIRSTMDIDLLGKTKNDETVVSNQIKEILLNEVDPDGLIFDVDSIQTEKITEDADYEGIRLRLLCSLGNTRINLQVDIGFGDIIHPGPARQELPPVLDFSAPKISCYSRESAIAEKYEAIVALGDINSRMKDFYDIWLLARQYEFKSEILSKAISLTFEKRNTDIKLGVEAFSDRFVASKQAQWEAFRRRLMQESIPYEFSEIVMQIKAFLLPITESIVTKTYCQQQWPPTGPWID